METTEIAETIHGHHGAHGARADDTLRKLAAIYVGVVAMLLSIATLGGSHATKTMLNANIHASDTYAFYQARNIRQTAYQLAADELELQLAAQSDPPQEARNRTEEAVKRYRATVTRYESDPTGGEGKKELLAKAKQWEGKRNHAAEMDPNFEYSEALFQIAIVLGSVSIVAASRPLLMLSGVLAVAASLLMINGYVLFMHLPFE